MKRLSFSCSLIFLTLFLVACSSTTTTPPSIAPIGTQTINTQTTITASSAIGSFQEYPLQKIRRESPGHLMPEMTRRSF